MANAGPHDRISSLHGYGAAKANNRGTLRCNSSNSRRSQVVCGHSSRHPTPTKAQRSNPILRVCQPDAHGRQHRGATLRHNPHIKSLSGGGLSRTSWVRDLTAEGVEPNPGPVVKLWTVVHQEGEDPLEDEVAVDDAGNVASFRKVVVAEFSLKDPSGDRLAPARLDVYLADPTAVAAASPDEPLPVDTPLVSLKHGSSSEAAPGASLKTALHVTIRTLPASRGAAAPVGTLTVIVVSASLYARDSGQPCLFRSTLAREIAFCPTLVVFGTCERDDNGKITIDFKVLDIEKRAVLVALLRDVAKRCSSCLTPESLEALPAALAQFHEQTVAKQDLRPWEYQRRAGSPDAQVLVVADDEATLDADLSAITSKRPKSDSSGSSGQQKAHVLFNLKRNDGGKDHMYKEVMLRILQHVVEDKVEAGAVLEDLCKLVIPMDYYRSHQDYDRFLFCFAWAFTPDGNSLWTLQTQVRYLQEPSAGPSDYPTLIVSNLSTADKTRWCRALAVRNALALTMFHQKIYTGLLQREWDMDHSECWAV